MTTHARRNNIEPEWFLIAVMVVIFLCELIAVRTMQRSGTRQFPIPDGSAYCLTCLNSERVGGFVSFVRSLTLFSATICRLYSLAFLGQAILSVIPLTLFALLISNSCDFACRFASIGVLVFLLRCRHAQLALGPASIFVLGTFPKLRERLGCLAFRAGLRYDCITHCRLHDSLLCLGSVGSTILPVGSLYIINFHKYVKGKTERAKAEKL